MKDFNENEDMLVLDEAHKSRMTEREKNKYIGDLKKSGMELYHVNIPEFPGVERTRLVMWVGKDGGRWKDSPWTGKHLAFALNFDNRIKSQKIRRKIVHPNQFDEEERVAYT